MARTKQKLQQVEVYEARINRTNLRIEMAKAHADESRVAVLTDLRDRLISEMTEERS